MLTHRLLLLIVAGLVAVTPALAQEQEITPIGDPNDPRVGLAAGWMDAEEAISNLELLVNVPRPEGFYDAENIGNLGIGNSDMGFQGDFAIVGNFSGYMIYDVSDPANPTLRNSIYCPGGQGDVSIFGTLLFMSVEEARGRLDCGVAGTGQQVDPERFRGVRIFDLADIDNPIQVAAIQTCRGSHTHTVVPDLNDPDHVYIYVSGASFVRPGEELEGCSRLGPDEDPNTSLFRIEVIKVPLAAPHLAEVVNEPRIFADEETGDIAGLWQGGNHGEGTQRTAPTNHCHDITVYPEIGLAAGACSGNGIVLDISDPANPVRIDEVEDPNFAYWHSATFSNDGSKVIFTDEWGGGMGPRCRATDPHNWGANAIYEMVDGKLEFRSHYKLPVVQSGTENCVAHNGSLIPVPGRDIKVQAWYQGGVSVFDFTDAYNPIEIAYFDRGPISDERLVMGGYWSVYWYNGHIYGSEIARGLDVFRLIPSEHLTQNEIDAAALFVQDEFNPQNQPEITWPAEFVVAHSYVDQLERSNALSGEQITLIRTTLQDAEAGNIGRLSGFIEGPLASMHASVSNPADQNRIQQIIDIVDQLADE